MKQAMILLTVVLAAAVVSVGFAQEAGYGPEMPEQGMMGEHSEHMMSGQWDAGMWYETLGNAELFLGNSTYLNLTESQVNQLQVMHESFKENTGDTRTSLSTLEDELTGLVSIDNPDMEGIKAKVKDVEEVRTALIGAQIEHCINSRKVLNQNQIGLADNLFEMERGLMTDQPGAGGPGL